MRTRTTPASVPSTSASVELSRAIRKVVQTELSIWPSWRSALYQCREKPPQTVTSFEALKE